LWFYRLSTNPNVLAEKCDVKLEVIDGAKPLPRTVTNITLIVTNMINENNIQMQAT